MEQHHQVLPILEKQQHVQKESWLLEGMEYVAIAESDGALLPFLSAFAVQFAALE